MNWPPRWPLSETPEAGDERDLCELVKQLDLDQASYGQLVEDAFQVTTSGPYLRALAATSYLLEQHGRLDEHALARIKAISEEKTIELAVKAATVTVADLGEFTAIAAAWTVDRDNDQIIPGAFARSIQRWRASGKRIPLHWNHRGEAHNIIGSIDSPSVREIDEGSYVEGKLDLEDSATAREAWRAMKSNSMSLSFGYVTTKNRRRNDGVNELLELDLIEVSIVPAPSNPDTRIIATKSLTGIASSSGSSAERTTTRARSWPRPTTNDSAPEPPKSHASSHPSKWRGSR